MHYHDPELLEQLAGAYVLGTLSQGARRRFAALLDTSKEAELATAGWHFAFAPFNDGFAVHEPPALTWLAIAKRTRPNRAQVWTRRIKAGWCALRRRLAARGPKRSGPVRH